MGDDNSEEIQLPLSSDDKRRKPPCIAAKCRNCYFFRDSYYTSFKKPCVTLGVKAYSRPCSHFFANPFQFLKGEKEFNKIAQLMDKYAKHLPGFLAWMNQEIATRRRGFSFGQPVVVRVIGDDYLKNYALASVISANKEYVFVQGEKFKGTFLHESIILEKDWNRKRAALIRRKKISDPKEKQYYSATKVRTKAYEVPTFDDFTKQLNRKKREDTGIKVLRIM